MDQKQKLIYAEQRAHAAFADARHAATWLDGSSEKIIGTVPWRYDLNEAKHLLQQAVKSIDRALELAAQAGDPDRWGPTGDFGREVDPPTAAEVMEQEG